MEVLLWCVKVTKYFFCLALKKAVTVTRLLAYLLHKTGGFELFALFYLLCIIALKRAKYMKFLHARRLFLQCDSIDSSSDSTQTKVVLSKSAW